MAMAEEFPLAEPFSLDLQWPANPGKGGDSLLDESLARFQMMVGEKSLTSYQTDMGDKNSYLNIPAYYLVEWLALNWWSFLYEPRKNDHEDMEQEFRSRHWLGTARNGFALPDVTFSPAGDTMEIVARSAYLRFAQLNFTESLTANVITDGVRSEFTKFIEQVLAQLSEKDIKNSVAHEAWDRITSTTKDEEEYCRLIGSMGLSPYVDHPEIDQALEKVANKISESMLTDLCEATNIGNFGRLAEIADNVSDVLEKAKSVNMHDLLKAQRPFDSTQKAYEWGYRSADAARATLGIAHDDPSCSVAYFDKLKIDPSVGSGSEAVISSIIFGAVARDDEDMRFSLTGSNIAQRKFAAARASFLAWSPTEKSSRLVTTARTRDQQASRAFAAEILVPEKYLHKRLGDRREVSSFDLDKISEEIGVAPTVVHYQARNHKYYVAEAA
jgi:hypothetical protein